MTSEKLQTCLTNTPYIYRSILTLPKKVNFGLEIELENVDFEKVKHTINKQFGGIWQVKPDKSLSKNNSAEIVSPVLQNNKDVWILLRKMGTLLEKMQPTFDNCSFQVNYDGTLLKKTKDRVRFLKLYAMYEDIIYKFSKGEDEKYRESFDMYASPIILTLKDTLRFKEEGLTTDMFYNNKRYGISFKDQKDLIEFRTPNGTYNPILWQNYITTFYYLLKHATSNKYNKKEIDEYIDKFMSIYLWEKYEQINQAKALKFINAIFPHQVDQTFFMHQYLLKTK